MALVPASDSVGSPLIAEVDMGGIADPSSVFVRATVVQASTIFYDTPATIDKADRLIAEAASHGSQLVVFPEAFIGGYPRGATFGVSIGSRSAKGKEDFRKYHAAAVDVPGPEVDRIAAIAGKYKVFLVMGVIERAGYTLYCTVLFFDPQGQYLGKHRKLMPTALERIIWGFGDGSTIPVYETPIGRIGALICWENRMPLLRTALYGKGKKEKIEVIVVKFLNKQRGGIQQKNVVIVEIQELCLLLTNFDGLQHQSNYINAFHCSSLTLVID